MFTSLASATFCFAQQTGTLAMANSIPDGSTFLVRLQDRLDTGRLQQGKRFKAKLAEDLLAPNGAMIPRGEEY